MPKLTMKYIRLLYLLGRNSSKVKKICVVNGEKMSDEDFEKCMAIVNQCKQVK